QVQPFNGGKLDRPALATGPSGIPNEDSVWLVYAETSGLDTGLFAPGAPVGEDVMPGTSFFETPQAIPGSTIGNFASVAVGPMGQVAVAMQDAQTINANG